MATGEQCGNVSSFGKATRTGGSSLPIRSVPTNLWGQMSCDRQRSRRTISMAIIPVGLLSKAQARVQAGFLRGRFADNIRKKVALVGKKAQGKAVLNGVINLVTQ